MRLFMLALCCVWIGGCFQKEGTNRNEPDDKVLVTIDSSKITTQALDTFLHYKVSEDVYLAADEKFKRAALESLVQTRAMALVRQKSLSEQEKLDIESRVAFYRDTLLATQYLNNHIEAKPVPLAAMHEYYDKHRDQFREEGTKRFRTIMSFGRMTDGQKRDLATAFDALNAQSDLRAITKRLVDNGIPVKYQVAEIKVSLLPEPLRGLLKGLKKGTGGKTSSGKMMAFAIVDEVHGGVQKPFESVIEDVRTRVTPIFMKAAIAKAAETAMQQVKVNYK